MNEIWKPTLFPYYEVSNLGRFRSVEREITVESRRTKPFNKISKGSEINPFIVKTTRYLQIKVNGKKYSAHRLVAFAFCEGFSEGLVVNHKNGIRDDNRAENLEWVTQAYNNQHAFRVNGRVPTTLGKFSKDHPTSKSVVSTDMKTGKETFYHCAMDAVREGFESSSISRCCTGESGSHKGKLWRFGDKGKVAA
ncbi:TPA: HNH endonuclease [Yersinia enterocolitica]|nr:HNH endonuclease [Yersinia enterocolitica]HEI6725083.1 HNH endonuclease [Yersinia enterocolitica]HEI6761411.1 HNH endonuclease [Yersinia enterocolitica]HEI6827317.1 HNH endonuclease [Yersinia enterocolitica]HEI6868314.1 HNH endonuclease [Yersinia enterocolitica]